MSVAADFMTSAPGQYRFTKREVFDAVAALDKGQWTAPASFTRNQADHLCALHAKSLRGPEPDPKPEPDPRIPALAKLFERDEAWAAELLTILRGPR